MKAPSLKVVGAVCGGRLDAPASQRLRDAIARFDGRKLVIALQEWKKPRSIQQNAYWFAVLNEHVVPLFRATGSDWDDYKIHCHVMRKLGYEQTLICPDGSMERVRDESSNFTADQWEEYMHRARSLLAGYGIMVPEPNELTE